MEQWVSYDVWVSYGKILEILEKFRKISWMPKDGPAAWPVKGCYPHR